MSFHFGNSEQSSRNEFNIGPNPTSPKKFVHTACGNLGRCECLCVAVEAVAIVPFVCGGVKQTWDEVIRGTYSTSDGGRDGYGGLTFGRKTRTKPDKYSAFVLAKDDNRCDLHHHQGSLISQLVVLLKAPWKFL